MNEIKLNMATADRLSKEMSDVSFRYPNNLFIRRMTGFIYSIVTEDEGEKDQLTAKQRDWNKQMIVNELHELAPLCLRKEIDQTATNILDKLNVNTTDDETITPELREINLLKVLITNGFLYSSDDKLVKDLLVWANANTAENEGNHCVNCAIEWARQYESDEEIALRTIERFRKYYKDMLSNWKSRAKYKGVLINEFVIDTVLNEVIDWLQQEDENDD